MNTWSQDSYLQKGSPNQYRARGEKANWWVEATDGNNVWVDASPDRYDTQADAETAAKSWAQNSGGEFIEISK